MNIYLESIFIYILSRIYIYIILYLSIYIYVRDIRGCKKPYAKKVRVSVYAEPLEPLDPLFDHLVHDAMYIVFV